MTERERKQKKKIQTIVAGSMASFFTLVLTMVVLITVNVSMGMMERNLKATNDELTRQLNSLTAEIDGYLDPERLKDFIDEYALRVLGYGRPGSNIFYRP